MIKLENNISGFTSLILACMLSLVISSCTPSPLADQLSKADKIMENSPDSSLLILKDIDTLALRSDKERALYKLLLAQTKIKTDDNSVDTLSIGVARKYFNDHPEKNYRLRSNFYSAYQGYLDSAYNDAIIWGAKALLESKAIDDPYWIAKSAETVGFILNACEFPRESLKYDSIACINYRKAGRIKNSVYSAVDLAINLDGAKMYNNADRLLSRLTKVVTQKYPHDSGFIAYVFDPAIRVKIKLQKWESADSLIRIKRSFVPVLNTADYLSLAKLELNKGNTAQTKVYLDSAHGRIDNSFDFEDYNIVLKNYAREINDNKLENDATSELLIIGRKIANTRIYNPVHKTLTDIINYDRESNLNAYKTKTYTVAGVCIFLLVAVIAILIFVRHRSYLNKKKLSAKESEHNASLSELRDTKHMLQEKEMILNRILKETEDLQNKINSITEDAKNKREILSGFINEEIPVIRELCESMPEFSGPAHNIAQRALILKENIEQKLSTQNIKWIIESADLVSNGLIRRLLEACPNLTDNYISLFSLFYLGFSSKAAGIILNIKRNAVDQRKKRLKEAINNSEIPDKNEFLSVLELRNCPKQT